MSEITVRYPLNRKRVFIAGHRGMVGSALLRRLASEGAEVLTAPRAELDLLDQGSVRNWFSANRPHAVFLAAARVGGIHANDSYPADFICENLAIQSNVIDAAFRHDVEKLMFLGSSCIYPREALQPIKESALLTGPLEPTNEWYAIAKIAGLKMCQAYRRQHGSDFVSVMPTNLYGPGDNFSATRSHVLPALIRRAHEARSSRARTFGIWGTGTPRREFLHVDDAADAMVHLMQVYSDPSPVNIGSGADISIADLANLVLRVVGVDSEIVADPTKPDGTKQKLMDSSLLFSTGWRPRLSLDEGIRLTYEWFVEQLARNNSELRLG